MESYEKKHIILYIIEVTILRIQIIGLGVVGSAQAYLMSKLGHDVFGYDINTEKYQSIKRIVEDIVLLDRPKKDVDITFICTPECTIEEVISKLIDEKIEGLYVIRSTLPVGTTIRLIKKYNKHICHNPEFLREKHAFEDVIRPSRIVIGECCKNHGDILEKLYEPLDVPIFRTDPTSSEIIKLVSNVMRSMMISFWNTIYLLCQRVGADINIIAEAADPSKVIGVWEGGKWGTRFFGKPYGGKCLPKDIKHMIRVLKEYNIDSSLLESVEKINKIISGDKNE